MAQKIPEGHPLRRLFNELTVRNFMDNLRLPDTEIIKYVSDLLAEFVHADNLYRIRNSQGRRLEDVGEMLLESEEAKTETLDTETERKIRKHIGDYTLFFTGMFPERLKQLKSGIRMDYFIDYIKAGKESYGIVAESSTGRFAEERALFLKLSDNFDYCVVGLNFVRTDLERLQDRGFYQVKKIIGS